MKWAAPKEEDKRSIRRVKKNARYFLGILLSFGPVQRLFQDLALQRCVSPKSPLRSAHTGFALDSSPARITGDTMIRSMVSACAAFLVLLTSSFAGERKEAAVRALGDLARKFKLHRLTEKTAL